VRGAAIYLHFDNLDGDLQHNSDFDYLFSHLLQSTQNLLADYNRLYADERIRSVLTLVTLASLHAVQDFYSHSDWIHNDFNETDGVSAELQSTYSANWSELPSQQHRAITDSHVYELHRSSACRCCLDVPQLTGYLKTGKRWDAVDAEVALRQQRLERGAVVDVEDAGLEARVRKRLLERGETLRVGIGRHNTLDASRQIREKVARGSG
jgi:hypothetical protein